LHYHCAAILEQIATAENYRPKLAVFSLIVLTSGDKHKHDVVTIDFDPKDRTGKGIGEILHKVMYVCPKYVDEQTPAPIREWLRAIDDTLDEVVEEANYQHPQVRRIFDLIERDQISPDERARMIEEYNREQLRRETFAEGKAEGERQEKIKIARALLTTGVDLALIVQATGLSLEEVVALKV
jgi:predicted transposase/invertase (TIGR01784 family)